MLNTPCLSDRPAVAIETHGCKLNQADSSTLESDFVQAGFRVVHPDEPADIYLVNSCTVTHIADRKARHALRAARRRNPNATIVATGCYVQRSPQALQGLTEVDVVVTNTDKEGLAQRLMELRREKPVLRGLNAASQMPSPRVTRTRAIIKIQEGCNQVCAYCIVPRVRGRERSVPPGEVLQRINEHVARGCKEVVLTGTQVGSYGFDLPNTDLSSLLRSILSDADVARLRVSSLQPQEINPGILSLWSDPRLCPHFHLALQSGSDEVLKLMRRRYTARQYMESVEMIREAVSGASITTDVIVGFPSETEAHYQQTYSLCDSLRFAAMHIFPYSLRPGTSAAHLSGRVDAKTRSRRVQEMLSLAHLHSVAFRDRSLGTTRQVLWEASRGSIGTDLWSGLTDNYIRVLAHSHKPLANTLTPALLCRQEEDLVHVQVLV